MSRRLRRCLGAVLVSVAFASTACGTATKARSTRPSTSRSTTADGESAGPTASAKATESASPVATGSSSPTASCADRVFATMTQDQRIGQLLLLGLANNQLGPGEVNEIRNDHVGSVWFVDRTYAGAAAVHAAAAAVQAQASGSATANVRFFVAANQEGGIIQALQGSGFSPMPTALSQGGLATSALQNDGNLWGRQLLAAGVNMNFAPVMDVVPPGFDAQNQPIGALQREYGHDPATAGSHGVAFLLGMRRSGVAVTLKHFPGLGRVTGNTDYTPATDTNTTATDPYIQSFKQGIDAGADFVMVAIATYTRIDPAHLAAFSPIVINQWLRGTLGFRG